MTSALSSLTNLSDDQLLAEVSRLATRERQASAALIHSLMELDARKLYLAQGYASLFTYCTKALHLSEHAALGRIEAARAARRLPAILDLLFDGSMTITNVRLLAPHLTEENHRELLMEARHRSKREMEEIVARLRPLPDVAAAIRRLPERRAEKAPGASTMSAGSAGAPVNESRVLQASFAVPAAAHHIDEPAPRASVVGKTQTSMPRPVIAPLAPQRYKVHFTVSRETHDKLRRAQDLLRHVLPNGDPAAVFDRALTLLVEHLEKQKCAARSKPHRVSPPATTSRHIPAAVGREVWARDEGRCAFAGSAGRCEEKAFLEFHHVVPYAAGGAASPANIELRCRAHNAYEADLFFGTGIVREAEPGWPALGPDRVASADATRAAL